MTTEFDDLTSIRRVAEEDARVTGLALWLADICVADADKREPGWTFQIWNAEFQNRAHEVWGDFDKFEYLDSCHSKLDHGKWHFHVFEPETNALIEAVYYALVKGHARKQAIEEQVETQSIIERFPDFIARLEAAGFVYDEDNAEWRRADEKSDPKTA